MAGGVCMAGGPAWQGGLHGRGACVAGVCMAGGHAWPLRPRHMVNERAVRILLECILVF